MIKIIYLELSIRYC